MMIGNTLNSIIRADGDPKYAMISMVVGAVCNIVLDPIFIFVLKMGVEGAAIATIISQIITFIMNIIYVKKFKSITITRENIKFKLDIAKKVSTLGISSFITQMSIVFVIAVLNNLLVKYGAESRFGSEIPITVLGIVMKISQILNSIIIGIAAGSQPILGYNYGAGKFDRVKKTLKIVLGVSLIVGAVAFILFQTIPDKLISIFGSGDEKYMEFACIAFRTYLLLCIAYGIQIPSGIFFQAIGKSVISAILSLSRQIVFLIPAMIIFGSMKGLMGVLYAGPFADGIAFLISGTFIILEIKKLGKNQEINSQALIDDTSTDNKLKEQVIITVSREYGSGGRYVARLLADKLGIKFYDKEFITKLAKETGLSEEYIELNEQKKKALSNLEKGTYNNLSNEDELFIKETKLIKEIAEKESCVIVGRCADFILKENKNVIKVFIYSDDESKMKRATEIYGLDKENAKKEIKNINKQRANHYKYYTGKEWRNYENYDICINSGILEIEKTVEIICKIVAQKLNVML